MSVGSNAHLFIAALTTLICSSFMALIDMFIHEC
jgi:hypothetical protein